MRNCVGGMMNKSRSYRLSGQRGVGGMRKAR